MLYIFFIIFSLSSIFQHLLGTLSARRPVHPRRPSGGGPSRASAGVPGGLWDGVCTGTRIHNWYPSNAWRAGNQLAGGRCPLIYQLVYLLKIIREYFIKYRIMYEVSILIKMFDIKYRKIYEVSLLIEMFDSLRRSRGIWSMF